MLFFYVCNIFAVITTELPKSVPVVQEDLPASLLPKERPSTRFEPGTNGTEYESQSNTIQPRHRQTFQNSKMFSETVGQNLHFLYFVPDAVKLELYFI